MKKFILSTALILSTAIAAPASAGSWQKFKSTVEAPVSGAVNLEVVLSEDMIHRANNLPKKLRDRGSARSFNDGFAGNGFYGDKDVERLRTDMQKALMRQFEKRGVAVSDTASNTLRITIVKAEPSRPTFEQLSRQPALSYSSFSRGGATLQAELLDASGQSLGMMSSAWYESDFYDAQFSSTWSDARRAMRSFAKNTAKTLAN